MKVTNETKQTHRPQAVPALGPQPPVSKPCFLAAASMTRGQGIKPARKRGGHEAAPRGPGGAHRLRRDTERVSEAGADSGPSHAGTRWRHFYSQTQGLGPASVLTKRLQRHFGGPCPYFIHRSNPWVKHTHTHQKCTRQAGSGTCWPRRPWVRPIRCRSPVPGGGCRVVTAGRGMGLAPRSTA